MDTRLGYPSEHLAGNNSIEISSPMYATAVGLVMNSIKVSRKNKIKEEELQENIDLENNQDDSVKTERLSFFEKFTDSIKNFLDNAE